MNIDMRRGLILLLVFACLTGLPWLVGYLRGDVPTREQACTQKCAEIKRNGHLVYRGPATPKSEYRYENSVCECR